MPGVPGDRPQHTIDQLVEDLAPVRRRGRSGVSAGLWLALVWPLTTALVLALGPLRPGAVEALLNSPRYLAETLLGLVSGGVLAWVGFQLCIPQAPRWGWRVLALALPLAWAALYVLGTGAPAVSVDMSGKRAGCEVQVFALALPLLSAGLLAARRYAALTPRWSGLLLGAAAGSVPALLMQLACIYDPAHALGFHLLPAAGVGLVGAWLGPRLLAR